MKQQSWWPSTDDDTNPYELMDEQKPRKCTKNNPYTVERNNPCLDGYMLMQTRYMTPKNRIDMAVIQLDSDAPIAGLNGQRNYHNNH